MANGFFPLIAPNGGGGINFEPVNNALMNYQNVRGRNQQFEQERQNQNALMQRYQSSDARQNEELAMQKQRFAAEQANLPFQRQMQQAQIDNTRSEIDSRKAEMAGKARTQQREDDFYNQFAAPLAATGVPPPNKLGGPMPDDQGVGRFSSIGQPQMPPPMRAGAPTGQSFNVAEGETGPGLQVGQPMPQGRPVAQPQAAPEQPTNLKDMFQRLAPDQKAIALGLLQTGKKEEFLNMLHGGDPSGKPATEQQSKDAFFVRRMMDETARLDKVIPMDAKGNFTGYDPTKANPYGPNDTFDVAGGYLGSIPTRQFNPEGWNRYYDTARSWLATILRKDTGATVTKEEMNWYFPMLFPQPGDKPNNIKDKAERRREYMEGLKAAAGPLSDRMNGNYTPGGGQWKMERLD